MLTWSRAAGSERVRGRALGPAVAVVAAVATLTTGCGGDSSSGAASSSPSPSGTAGSSTTPAPSLTAAPTPAPSATVPTSTAAAAGVPGSLRREARASTDAYLGALTSALARPGQVARGGSAPGGGALAGSALEQLRNQSAELADQQQHVEGSPRVVSSVVTSRTTSPATMTVAACLDNSRVRLVGRGGKTVGRPQRGSERTLNLLTLVQRGGTWVVTGQTFPDDPTC